eukprot:194588-Chlamydomonas_euryale.AAC.3
MSEATDVVADNADTGEMGAVMDSMTGTARQASPNDKDGPLLHARGIQRHRCRWTACKAETKSKCKRASRCFFCQERPNMRHMCLVKGAMETAYVFECAGANIATAHTPHIIRPITCVQPASMHVCPVCMHVYPYMLACSAHAPSQHSFPASQHAYMCARHASCSAHALAQHICLASQHVCPLRVHAPHMLRPNTCAQQASMHA